MTDLDQMLENWESVYKKGLLTFWLLLLLDEKPAYPYEMSAEVTRLSEGMISADGNSIYRAVSRFEEMGLVASESGESKLGPPRKYYSLTEEGHGLLRMFIERNIFIFQHPAVAERIQHVMNGESDGK
ncbi:MAG: PadR family transcriptional regulator [Anaerolineae bacterium CFX3]|nr:PadR family transcriptional regulator [Anaerolineae bacterium CFX3]MCQ3946819.1 PadR family transcriptional regulator [Anaerolineae bacterium]